MSTLPDSEFDLEKLFLPAWAQEPSSTKYANYEGGDERTDRRGGRDRRGPRPPRRDGPPGERRDGNRPRFERRGPPGEQRGGPRGPGDRPGRGGPSFRRGEDRDRREHREPLAPLPELDLTLLPDEKGVESLARQIKVTGRAYPLFDIAQLILQKPERHLVRFSIRKNAEGQPVQPLFVCALDDVIGVSEDELVGHVLKKHFATFYQAERTAAEPPKGKYTFVAQCGISGVILGPPNHHDYQNLLRKLHNERFSRMPFDVFKSRVRIVRDEAVVKQWVEEQSWRTEYVCLNLPEALKLPNLEAVEKHFRETHKENIIKPVESHLLSGAKARALPNPGLCRLVRSVWEDQRRFPLSIATVLSQQFATHGLQFFKVNKTVTHVSVARPHYLDLNETPVSEGIKRIVECINARPRCSRRDLIEALAPSPTPTTPTILPVAEPAPAAEGQAPAPATQPAAPPQPTEEQTMVIADLHWLVHQGHVIEFANGSLETAKKPLPRPPKPAPKPAEAVPGTTSVVEPTSGGAPADATVIPTPGSDAIASSEGTPIAANEPAVAETSAAAANAAAGADGEAASATTRPGPPDAAEPVAAAQPTPAPVPDLPGEPAPASEP